MRDPITNEEFWVGHKRIAVLIFAVVATIALIVADTPIYFVELIRWSLSGLLAILFPYAYGQFFKAEYYGRGAPAWAAATGFFTALGWITLTGSVIHFLYVLVWKGSY